MKNKLIKTLVVIIFLTLTIGVVSGYAQLSRKEIKTIKKSSVYYDQKKYDKAIKTITPVINKYSNYGSLWNITTEYYYQRYIAQKDKEQEELVKLIMKMDKNIKFDPSLSTQYMYDFLNICSKATLKCETTDKASMYLRIYLVDTPVDTAVSNEAKSYYENAETSFFNEDYHKALELYKKAIAADSNYFRATLYAGDCYWLTERHDDAIAYYQKAIIMEPALLEPRKYLTDAYMSTKSWDLALDACIDGILVYPDAGMFTRLDSITKMLGKTFDRHWISRPYSINQIRIDQTEVSEEPWSYYRDAKFKIQEFCDEAGIITKQNTISSQEYLETCSWEYMLVYATGEDFDFAKKMEKEGNLDCYVFISLFHYSVYDQFVDFVSKNRDKAKNYIKNYLMK